MLRQEDWEFQTKLTTQRGLAPSFTRLTSISQNALDFFSSCARIAHYVGEDEAAYTLFLCPALYVLWILSVKPPGSLQHKAANGSPGSVSWGRTFLHQPENWCEGWKEGAEGFHGGTSEGGGLGSGLGMT